MSDPQKPDTRREAVEKAIVRFDGTYRREDGMWSPQDYLRAILDERDALRGALQAIADSAEYSLVSPRLLAEARKALGGQS